jgi:hypothetical protein
MRLEGCIVIVAHPSRRRFAAPQDEGFQNTFAPEGASRCRALTSGLKDRAAGRKENLSEKWADLQGMEATSQGKFAVGRILGPPLTR